MQFARCVMIGNYVELLFSSTYSGNMISFNCKALIAFEMRVTYDGISSSSL